MSYLSSWVTRPAWWIYYKAYAGVGYSFIYQINRIQPVG